MKEYYTPTPQEKKCSECGTRKPITLFYRQKKGHKSRCIPCYMEYNRAYWRRPDVRARRKIQTKSYREGLKKSVFDHYGSKCSCCGEADLVFLAIDHIGGGGSAQRRELKYGCGQPFYLWLVQHNYPTGFRVLCHNCNWAVHRGVCPHSSRVRVLS